jgi:hypothetical protein
MPVIAAVYHSHLPSTFCTLAAFVVAVPEDWVSYHLKEKHLDIMCWAEMYYKFYSELAVKIHMLAFVQTYRTNLLSTHALLRS